MQEHREVEECKDSMGACELSRSKYRDLSILLNNAQSWHEILASKFK